MDMTCFQIFPNLKAHHTTHDIMSIFKFKLNRISIGRPQTGYTFKHAPKLFLEASTSILIWKFDNHKNFRMSRQFCKQKIVHMYMTYWLYHMKPQYSTGTTQYNTISGESYYQDTGAQSHPVGHTPCSMFIWRMVPGAGHPTPHTTQHTVTAPLLPSPGWESEEKLTWGFHQLSNYLVNLIHWIFCDIFQCDKTDYEWTSEIMMCQNQRILMRLCDTNELCMEIEKQTLYCTGNIADKMREASEFTVNC